LDEHGGGTITVARSARDALHRLVEPTHQFTHLLLQATAAGPHMRDLLGVTAGETGSKVDLILLGQIGHLGNSTTLLRAETPESLGTTLGASRRARLAQAPMSTSDIAVAFTDAEIECRFQPIVQLSDRRPVGVETLARLHHPQRGTIGPDLFIPQIERAGLSLRLTEAVARCAMISIEPAFLDLHDLFITINLPLDVLLFPESLNRIDEHRRNANIPVARILIELTESRPVIDLASLSVALERWRTAGYRVAIDDMGPEMMNQRELFDLPFNVVKLDKDVVLRSQTDHLAFRYLQRTVDNAKLRYLSIIAEGIENEAMWNRMRDMGVEHAQGFLIARALPANALGAWIDAWNAQLTLPPDRS
jgi:EAL domain-containing protein (putative c-di-GMP-specific phosphodiesterase class I)